MYTHTPLTTNHQTLYMPHHTQRQHRDNTATSTRHQRDINATTTIHLKILHMYTHTYLTTNPSDLVYATSHTTKTTTTTTTTIDIWHIHIQNFVQKVNSQPTQIQSTYPYHHIFLSNTIKEVFPKSSTLGIPTWSPTVVLTEPDDA